MGVMLVIPKENSATRSESFKSTKNLFRGPPPDVHWNLKKAVTRSDPPGSVNV